MADQANEGVIVVDSDGEYDFMATSSHTNSNALSEWLRWLRGREADVTQSQQQFQFQLHKNLLQIDFVSQNATTVAE